ncbi:MAG: MoxR family ATPase [Nannocystaceae bacterium]|nr:MoxR family ATPase [Nannocystaceae bacterium]
MNLEQLGEVSAAIRNQVGRVLLGQDELIEHVLVAIVARGHVLIEGVPGLGKTLLVRVLSKVVGCTDKRIQFTPDLMPSDVTGGNVFNQGAGRFEFIEGPIFAQFVLADEINRAPAKTQSALLEAMAESSVSTDGVTRTLSRPFFVMATQNPVESQGTYPLPEAQLDRFLLKISVGHPEREVEMQILRNHLAGFNPSDLEDAGLEQVVDAEGVRAMQEAVGGVNVSEALLAYVTEIVARTRDHRSIFVGASPRGSISLAVAARARAALHGRDFAIPDDVKALAPAVLRHRLMLQPDAEFEGLSADNCLEQILAEVPVPKAVT